MLAAAAGPLRPSEIRELAQAGGEELGMATVYRQLKALVEGGELRVVELPRHCCLYYEKASPGSRCYSLCRMCERVFSSTWDAAALVGSGNGSFRVDWRLVLLYGRCGECKEKTHSGPDKSCPATHEKRSFNGPSMLIL